MSMRLLIYSGCLVVAGALGASADTRMYELSGFDRIEVSDGVQLIARVGGTFTVEAEALRGDLDRLTVEVRRGRLVISRTANWGFWSPGRSDSFRVTVGLPDLAAVRATSGAGAEVISDRGDLDAAATSGASLRLTDLDIERLRLESSSGSSIVVEGVCLALEAEASSGASIQGRAVTCATGALEASSGASIQVTLTEAASGGASSGGSVRIFGDVDLIDIEVSSGGSFAGD